jgi:hypothetical protein
MVMSAAQLPGLFFVTFCALALPVSPFQHAMLVMVAMNIALFVWPISARIAAGLRRKGDRAGHSGTRLRRVAARLAVALAVLVGLAVLQSARRPSPDGYWDSLASIYVTRPFEEYETRYGISVLRSRPRDYAITCRGRVACCDALDAATCFCFAKSTDGLGAIGGVGNGGASGCPFVEVRREAKGGRKVISRQEVYSDLLFGQSSAHIYDPTGSSWTGTNEGAILNTLAVRDAVSVPWPWIAVAGIGLGLVAWIFWKERRQSRAEAQGWLRVPPLAGTGAPGLADRAQEQAIIWRYAIMVLVVSFAPMVFALVLGVGR